MRAILLSVFVIANITNANAQSVSVMIGGDEMSAELDACGGSSRVVGLDPRGDNFLSVRAGPGTQYREIARLRQGAEVYNCDQEGDWEGIAWEGEGRLSNQCNDTQANEVARPYDGPCKSGWVFRRYIEQYAG